MQRTAHGAGFIGTCMMVNFLGRAYGITARHVLGKHEIHPMGVAVPLDLSDGRMDLVEPEAIFWYNGGDYDHLADVAVLEFSRRLPCGIEFFDELAPWEPGVGSEVIVFGFPRAKNAIHWNLEHEATTPALSELASLGISRLDVAVWCDHEFSARCTARQNTIEGETLLGLQGSPDQCDWNGMSGGPVFSSDEQGNPALAGMFVRGSAAHGVGHFLTPSQIVGPLLRVAAKHSNNENKLRRLAVSDPDSMVAELWGVMEANATVLKKLSIPFKDIGEAQAILQRTLRETLMEAPADFRNEAIDLGVQLGLTREFAEIYLNGITCEPTARASEDVRLELKHRRRLKNQKRRRRQGR